MLRASLAGRGVGMGAKGIPVTTGGAQDWRFEVCQ
jgi:hypothetical protein